MKKLLFSIMALVCACTANAQDTLYYKKGFSEIVKLVEVAPGYVTYRYWDNQGGPLYRLSRRGISSIATHSSGKVWIDEKSWERTDKSVKFSPDDPHNAIPKRFRTYKNNILSFIPTSIQSNGIGIGLAYEHVSKDQRLGIRIPFVYSFYKPGAYVMPGVRIYPLGQRIFTFFVTPSLYAGYGSRIQYADSTDNYGKLQEYEYYKEDFQMGFFLDIGMTIHFTEQIGFTMAGGGGVNYLDLANSNTRNCGFGIMQWSFIYRF